MLYWLAMASSPEGHSMDASLKRDGDEPGRHYDKVFGYLRGQLVDGHLRAGDRLLPERELATRLGVSRPVVREVLRALAAIGVIEIRHGFGSIVRRPDFSELGDLFTLMLAQQDDVVEHVLEARIAIEREAIRLACQRSTSADIALLRTCLKQIEATIHDPAAGAEADFAFHAAMIAAAHSPTLESLHAAIANLLRRSHFERRVRITTAPEVESYAAEHHRRLVDAIIERNEAMADQLIMSHLAIGASLERRAG
jgi:GntR family transcriptional repressor for pyruvate dehydrogenase complex